MQIDLNGMYYIVNLTSAGPDLMAEIVDEGFRTPVRRSLATCLGDIVRLIRQHTGMKPDADTLKALSGYLEDQLDRIIEVASGSVMQVNPLQQIA